VTTGLRVDDGRMLGLVDVALRLAGHLVT